MLSFKEYLIEARSKLKVTKAYFKGYKIHNLNTGKYYICEYVESMREWGLYELDEDGDVYGYKEWVEYYPNLKSAKKALEMGWVV